MAKVLIVMGLVLVLAGIVLLIFPHALRWMGRLPGDFFWKSGSVSFYFPLATSLLVSLILSLLFWFLRR
jgi:hypothetical protein